MSGRFCIACSVAHMFLTELTIAFQNDDALHSKGLIPCQLCINKYIPFWPVCIAYLFEHYLDLDVKYLPESIFSYFR